MIVRMIAIVTLGSSCLLLWFWCVYFCFLHGRTYRGSQGDSYQRPAFHGAPPRWENEFCRSAFSGREIGFWG